MKMVNFIKDHNEGHFGFFMSKMLFLGLFLSFSIYGFGQNNNPQNSSSQRAETYIADQYWLHGGGGLTNQLRGKQNNTFSWFGENGSSILEIVPNKSYPNISWIFANTNTGTTHPILLGEGNPRIVATNILKFSAGGRGQANANDPADLTILNNGNIGIGTIDPSQKLQVNGNARFEDSKVFMGYTHNEGLGISQTNLNKYALFVVKGILSEDFSLGPKNTWSDFVFNKDYDLKSLKELEEFIETNNHLPEMPSALQVKEEGYSLHDMNIKLLQKVEELTLYVIQQNKEIENLKITVTELKTE